ncbi:hypothetical protein CK936_34160 [Streptomyces albireticuli]|uniref:Uncharacterized protein n=1 Tax=Streptomyces albireticuli TaxID=1940 RepID=A0A2A2CZ25_9ACTN|nr:hypothetical protein CK936_34160 [Streptomyces albireticuli]
MGTPALFVGDAPTVVAQYVETRLPVGAVTQGKGQAVPALEALGRAVDDDEPGSLGGGVEADDRFL